MNAHRAHEGAKAELPGCHESPLRGNVETAALNIEDQTLRGSAAPGNIL
jgi:hypothetical protein